MKVYAKDSFDRFGDDLTELILSYLTLEDKVRLECVSKQWRSLVFNKQLVIEMVDIILYFFDNKTTILLNKIYRKINDKIQLNEKSLELLLKKCSNIRKINLKTDVNSDLFITIWSILSEHQVIDTQWSKG